VPSALNLAVGHRVAHEVHVVAVRVVLAEVTAPRLLPGQGRHDERLGEVDQETELDGLEEVGVEPLPLSCTETRR
jgi:hypothetical protein